MQYPYIYLMINQHKTEKICYMLEVIKVIQYIVNSVRGCTENI